MPAPQSNQLAGNGSRRGTFQHSVAQKTHMDLPLGRFSHLIALFALMNKSDAGREYSDADSSSVVELLTGEAHTGVNGALMPAVAWVNLLNARIAWREKAAGQAFFWSGVLLICQSKDAENNREDSGRNIWKLAVHRRF